MLRELRLFNVKHAFLVMQLLTPDSVSFRVGGLLKMHFSKDNGSYCIKLFSTSLSCREPMRQSRSCNLLSRMTPTFNWDRQGLLAQ